MKSMKKNEDLRMKKKLTNEEEKEKRKKILCLLLIVIIFLFIIWFFFLRSTKDYNINREAKVNIIKIDRVITSSNVCDEKWISDVKKLIKKLDKESIYLSKLKTDDKSYKKKIKEFISLQEQLEENLDDIIKYLDDYDYLDNKILVSNLKHTYQNYKQYYENNIENI